MRRYSERLVFSTLEAPLTYPWFSVALSMVRKKISRFRFRILRVTGNPGGANEAVIRMLISIGRCVARSRSRSL